MSVTTKGRTGSKSGIGTTPVAITDDSSILAKSGVEIRSYPSNLYDIYVGIGPKVTAGTRDVSDGFILKPGESVLFPYRNACKIYVVSNESGPSKVSFIVM